MSNQEATHHTDKAVPDYAHTVVVPIANPATAPELLKLARAFVQRDGGRLIALAVTLSDGDAELRRQRLDELRDIVDTFAPRPKPNADPMHTLDDVPDDAPPPVHHDDGHIVVDFVTRTANSIARGILDEARDTGAELIVLGVQKPIRGAVNIGAVAQSVMSAAPCDVLVYRLADNPDFHRIVVPVDGSSASRMAVRMSILFGNAFSGCPVEAVHVRRSDQREVEGRAALQRALEDLPGRGTVKEVVTSAYDPAEGLLSRLDKGHLVVVGFSRRSELQRWLDEDSDTRKILDRAPGPVLLAVRSTETVTTRQRVSRRLLGWIRPTLTDVEQEQIVWTATGNAALTLDYSVLMVIAATLASLGLMLNSAAVIIGAMLVAPLMSPLNAFAVGLSTARLDILRRSMGTAIAGVVIASTVGFVLGTVLPMSSPSTEMLARVNPTLLDAFVALASGVVGSYATARKDIPSALAGVAIAAALVPPICTFGLMVALGDVWSGLGALLLFLTNIVSIIVVATGMFIWLGLRPRRLDRRSRAAYVSIIIFVLLSLPAIITLLDVGVQAQADNTLENVTREVFAGFEVQQVDVSADNSRVRVSLIAPVDFSSDAVEHAQGLIAERTGQTVQVEVVVSRLVMPRDAVLATLPPSSGFVLDGTQAIPAPPTATPTLMPTPTLGE